MLSLFGKVILGGGLAKPPILLHDGKLAGAVGSRVQRLGQGERAALALLLDRRRERLGQDVGGRLLSGRSRSIRRIFRSGGGHRRRGLGRGRGLRRGSTRKDRRFEKEGRQEIS